MIVTSNRTREVHDALKRRCLYHWVGYPTAERELSIVRAKVPGISALPLDLALPPPSCRNNTAAFMRTIPG